MAETPIIPPLRKPVSQFTTPLQTDAFYVEIVNRDDPAYKDQAPVKRGTLYSSMIGAKPEVIAAYPNLYFLRETRVGQSDQLVSWLWASDRTAESSFNAEISYALEAVTSPTFARSYTIRRDVYDDSIPLELGLPLTGLVGVEIVDGGVNYTQATGAIDTDATVEFVVSDGVIISGVVTNEGSGVLSQGLITITGDGGGAIAKAIIQPSSAVLVAQKKSEFPDDSPLRNEYIQVTRVYQTLPGPTINSTRIDEDGAVVNIATTQKIAATIISDEKLIQGTWYKVTRQQQDNVYVGNEVVETREVKSATTDGFPMYSSRIDQDGFVVQITSTLSDVQNITEGETLTGSGLWTRTNSVAVSDLVSREVVEQRVVPGNPVPASRLDKDSVEVTIIRTLKDTTTITTQEIISGGFWVKTTKEPLAQRLEGNEPSDLVSWEIVEARALPGNSVPSSRIDQDHETANIHTRLRDETAITPGASEAGGFLTTVEGKEVTDLVSEEVTTVKRWLDEALYSQRLPESLIPTEFRASIPTVTESHILVGTASMPTLSGSQIFVQERQLTKIFYELRTEQFGENLAFPIIQVGYENTELYGGGVLEVTRTLNNSSMTTDTGEDVTRSVVNPIGDNLMWIKETARRYSDAAWPINPSRLWDENFRVEYDQTEQVVASGTSEDPDPGGVFAWVSEVKAIDKWRSQKINISKPAPAYISEATALISYEYRPYRFPGLLYLASAGYYVRHADATLVQHKIKTWWLKSTSTPTVGETGSGSDVEIDEIIMDDVVISSLNSTTTLDYSSPVLHDDLTTFGQLFYPATTPSYTEYALGTPTGTTQRNVASIYTGGTSYVNGDTLTISSGGFTMSVDVLYVSGTGVIGATTSIDDTGTYPSGSYGPIAATGGSGTGAYFYVLSLSVPTYTPGTAWIGTYRVVGAVVRPEREKDVWKIITESVVMR